MNARTWLLLIVAIGVAAATAFAVRNRLHQAEPAAAVVAETKVLVAVSPISPGGFVQPGSLAFVDWPASTLQPTYMTQAAHTAEEFNGAVARRAIAAGEPITPNLLVKASEGGFMSAVLQPGMRAVSIAVNATSGNAGFVFPGDKVDLIVTHTIPVNTAEGQPQQNIIASETFIENVRVLAIDQMLDNPENKAILAKTVTIEVTPKQAEMVNVATDLGKISLSLRSLAAQRNLAAKEGEGIATGGEVVTTPEALPTNPWGEPDPSAPLANTTSGSEVSKVLGNSGAINAPVNVIRGNASEKLQFNQGTR